MSLFRPEIRLLGCSPSSLALLAAPAAVRQPPATLVSLRFEPGPAAGATLIDRVQQLRLDAKRRSVLPSLRLYVTLDDVLTRIFVVTPPGGTRNLRELEAAAAARFAALYGESPEAWRLTADWHASLPFVACALPNDTYRALEAFARAHHWQLASVSPLLARAWNHLRASLASPGWLLAGHGSTLTIAYCERQRVLRVRTLSLVGRPALAELELVIEQERLRALSSTPEAQTPSLSWTGTADWLPAASQIAGLASHTLAWPTAPASGEDDPVARLALAGAGR